MLGSDGVRFVELREAWERRMLSFAEAFELQQLEDVVEDDSINFQRMTPRRKRRKEEV